MPSIAKAAPLRPVRLGLPQPEIERRADGALLIRSREPLPPYSKTLTDPLVRWAREAPDRIAFAHRDPDGSWQRRTYAEVADAVARIAAALLRRGLSAERPVANALGMSV